MTQEQKNLSRKFIIYKLFSSMWFLGAVWLYFYRLYINDQQVGILDGMSFAIGLIAEVPSGALADKFGRGRIVRLGQTLIAAGLFVQALGVAFPQLFIGQVIVMIGLSFVSGADEALFFDKLKFDRDSLNWRKLVTRASQAALIGSVVAVLIGGRLHLVDPRLPWILTSLAFLCAVATIWNVKDPIKERVKQKLGVEVKHYLKDIATGFQQFKLPNLSVYIPTIVVVQGLFYAAGYGLLRLVLLDRFDFSPFAGSVVLAVASVISVVVLGLMHRYASRLSERRVISSISVLAAASLLLAVGDIGMWGCLVIFILHTGEHALQPFMSEVLNKHAPDEQRATVLSVASFMRMMPYVVLAPIIGALNTQGNLQYFLVAWGGLIVVATTIYLLLCKRDTKIEV